MSFKEDLVKARGHLIIIIGVIIGLALILRLEKYSETLKSSNTFNCIEIIDNYNQEELTDEEIKFAKIAWKYFQNNYNKETGMVNSVDKYTASTMWDTGSYIFALHSAFQLNIIDKKEFDNRINKLLDYLYKMPLFNNELPNKSYSTTSFKMVNYVNKITEKGIGFSAIDLGRLILALNTININYPETSVKIKKVIKRFNFSNLCKEGKTYGAYLDKNEKINYIQEGRLGYEEYAAKGLSTLNLNLNKAKRYDDYLSFVDIYGINIPTDTRDFYSLGANNYVLSEPYILNLLEFYDNDILKDFAYRIYKVQEERFKKENILTAVSEDNIDRKPYFLYNTIFVNGKKWACINEKNQEYPELKTLSTKVCFAWHYLYRTEYTSKLIEKIKNNYDVKRGWYSGIYEKDNSINKSITCNTNSIILESLFFKKKGKLYSMVVI